MESLLVVCLPYLSDYLEVKDLFRLESVSKCLHETIQHGDVMFQQLIRAQVGYSKDYPSSAPVRTDGSGWERQYSSEVYPFKLCFHAKLEHDGLIVENLSVNKIRDMGKAVAQFLEELSSGAPEHTRWNKWYSPGHIGPRGGSVVVDFKQVCGIVLVFLKHSYVRGESYYDSHGFLDESNQCFPYAVKRERLPMKPGENLDCKSYLTTMPRRMYDDITEDYFDPRLRYDFDKLEGSSSDDKDNQHRFCDIWTRVDPTTNNTGDKLGLLRDSSGTFFAITSCRQLCRRLVQSPESSNSYSCQELTPDQRVIAERFLAPFIAPGHLSIYNAHVLTYNAKIVLGFDYRAPSDA